MRRYRQRGAEAIEFALLSPVLVVLIFGTFNMGWLFLHRLTLAGCLRTAAHDGAVADPLLQESTASTSADTCWTNSGLTAPASFTTVVNSGRLTLSGTVTLNTLASFVPMPNTISINTVVFLEPG